MAKKVNLGGLNKDQKEAVTSINGVIQANSVAGSGKTKVLTYRIAYMIEQGIKPENILVATFSKKASTEMIERLETLISKKNLRDLTIGTFHSIGYHILKDEYQAMNHPLKNFQLLQGKPLQWLVRECLDDLRIETSQSYNENIFVAEINKLKMANLTPESYVASFLLGGAGKHEENVMRVYELYESKKTAKKLIDFNDMLFRVYYLFMENPRILKRYQNKFQYVLVDEAQDNNGCQYDLIEMLAEPQNNIFIVGDDDQSIYKFRGAQPDQFIEFKDKFNAHVINLQTNYRSLPYILETANKVIKNNTIRVLKELKPFRQTQNADIEKPYMMYASDEDDEAGLVVTKMEELQQQGRSFGDMAVLYRTNAQSRALEDQLIGKGIPYVVFNGISFYERAEVKDLMAYLKLAMNPNDNESLKRIINKPSRYLGKKFMDDLEYTAKQNRCSLYYALGHMKNAYRTQQNVNDFTIAIQNTRFKLGALTNVGDIIQFIRNAIKYDEFLVKENGNEEDNVKIENVNSLIGAASRYTDPQKFIEYAEMVANAKVDENIPAVRLMTIHKSKGLEHDVIFIVGASEGLLPHKYALEESDMAIEEERRLAYVGITRARDFLMVTSPEMFQGKHLQPSRFLSEGEFIELERPEVTECAK